MADEVEAAAEAGAPPKRRRRAPSDVIAAGRAHLEGGGDNSGEAGDNVTAEAGDKEVESDAAGGPTAIERMEAMASEAELRTRSLVADARDFLLDQIKVRPKPWGLTPYDEQRDVAAACEHAARELVRRIVEAVRADDPSPIRALLESYAEKDGIKVTLKVKTFSEEEALEAVIGLHKAQGKHVLITVASADDYSEEGGDPELQPDQATLEFEAGDDRDLAGEDLRRVNLETGYIERREEPDGAWAEAEPATLDELREEGTGEWRISIDSGMLEHLPQGADADSPGAWEDIRAAKPDELEAERAAQQA